MNNKELIGLAFKVLENSYSPYSNCKVGAALLCKNGKVYTGCNVENASFGATNCAERTAFFKAISEGEREFLKIAIVGNSNSEFKEFMPCGICRQVMSEFCKGDFEILVAKSDEDYKTLKLSELLPFSFSVDSL